jgi:anti-sigma B factor antagonist
VARFRIVAGALSVEITSGPDGTRVVIGGEIDAESQTVLSDTLADLCDQARLIELDLSGVTFMDSSGIAMLLVTRAHATAVETSLVLRSPSERVRRLLDLTAVAPLFTIVH